MGIWQKGVKLMQIVIKIPEVYYEALRKTDRIVGGQRSGKTLMSVIYDAVAVGTPLPKGHGRLIDVNDLLDRVELEDTDENREYNAGSIITLEDVDFIPTIIEADKGE
jgi:hypothetical protein